MKRKIDFYYSIWSDVFKTRLPKSISEDSMKESLEVFNPSEPFHDFEHIAMLGCKGIACSKCDAEANEGVSNCARELTFAEKEHVKKLFEKATK